MRKFLSGFVLTLAIFTPRSILSDNALTPIPDSGFTSPDGEEVLFATAAQSGENPCPGSFRGYAEYLWGDCGTHSGCLGCATSNPNSTSVGRYDTYYTYTTSTMDEESSYHVHAAQLIVCFAKHSCPHTSSTNHEECTFGRFSESQECREAYGETCDFYTKGPLINYHTVTDYEYCP